MDRFEEARRWAAQSLRDLKAAEDSFKSKNYEWSCFQTQQAAEKAIKALLYIHGRSSWGNSITELLDYVREVEHSVDEQLYVAGRELDRHYIPSRYPNAFESGYPSMYYDESVAMRALESGKRIISWVRECLKKAGLEL